MEEKEYWKNLQVIFWLLSCGEKKTIREFQVLAKINFFSQPIKLVNLRFIIVLQQEQSVRPLILIQFSNVPFQQYFSICQ